MVELDIESIAIGGDGVAREPGGRVVFVPRTAPGDRVEARIVTEKRTFARALPERILRPGPDRREPPCPYYVACGGCQLQHLTPEAQRAAKRSALADALERIGKLEVAPAVGGGDGLEVPLPAAPGPEFGYRNRITLTLRREPHGETDGGAAGDVDGVTAGYHRYDDPARLLDVGDCPLGEPSVREAWGALRAAWGEDAAALPGGPELRVTVRASEEHRVAILVTGGDAGAPGDPERIGSAVPALASYHWIPSGGEPRTLAGAHEFEDRWDGTRFGLAPAAFLQPNRTVAAAVDAWLLGRAGDLAGRRVLDLYAGVGARTIRWAAAGAEVVACEVDEDAVRSGREAAARRGVACEFVVARVEDALSGLLPADLVVLNPPRRGVHRAVTEVLSAAAADGTASRLAYASCDPATLARDLARLRPAWRVAAVQPFDAFPNTAHVETAVWLEAAGA